VATHGHFTSTLVIVVWFCGYIIFCEKFVFCVAEMAPAVKWVLIISEKKL
jgi:hypothetical protein